MGDLVTLNPKGPWVMSCWNCDENKVRLIEEDGKQFVQCCECGEFWMETWILLDEQCQ